LQKDAREAINRRINQDPDFDGKKFPYAKDFKNQIISFSSLAKKKIPKLQHNRINTQLSRKNDEKNCNELHSIVLMLGVFVCLFWTYIIYSSKVIVRVESLLRELCLCVYNLYSKYCLYSSLRIKTFFVSYILI